MRRKYVQTPDAHAFLGPPYGGGTVNWEAFMALPIDLRRRLKEEGAALAAAMELLQADIEREEAEIALKELRAELDRWPTVDEDPF